MTDHLFPRYHVRPPGGFLNDPNGPVVLDGLVHLYFQYRTTPDRSGPVRWGHVTSPDLVDWRHHPPALVPHPSQGDRDGCWSGNTVVDDAGRLRAFYSGLVASEPLQRTLAAVSSDGGRSFGAPREVVPAPADGDVLELRDPFVWREGSSWRMALGAAAAGETAVVRLYASDDLDRWTYLGPLARRRRTRTAAWDSGAMWECPQVLRHDGLTVVVVGTYAPPGEIMDVLSFVAPPPGEVDVPASALHLVDHGPNFYAPSLLADGPLGPVLWGWATEGRSPGWCADDGWSGMLTLPRLVTPRPDGSLSSAPVPGLAALRVAPAGRPVADAVDGLGAQLELLLEPGDGSAATLRLCCGPGEHLEITVDPAAGRVRVDRDHASRDARADRGVTTVEGLGDLRSSAGVRGFVDGSILELFLPGGRVVTTRFYPTTPPPWRLELVGTGVAATVWELAGPGPSPLPAGTAGDHNDHNAT